MNTSVLSRNARPSAWQPMLFGALAGGLGWGIRGQYGHETGAMIAGLLVSLTLVHLMAAGVRSADAARAVALTTVAIGFGGSMTYGQTIGLTQNVPLLGNLSALAWGFLGLALKGGIWIGFAGAFLGMGLSGKPYRPLAILRIMLGLLLAFAVGVALLNTPFDPAHRSLPAIYFSESWRWQPDAVLKPRPEVWGGLLVALTTLLLYLRARQRDRLAFNLGLWGMLGGALGFTAGQSLQAYHAWHPVLFQHGIWLRLDPLVNWWNFMETTFGAVFGGLLGLGLWLNRGLLTREPSPEAVRLRPWLETLLVASHVLLLLSTQLFGDAYVEIGLVMAILPLVAVAGGRWAPCVVALPVTALPIALRTFEQRVLLEPTFGPIAGAFWLVAVPLALSTTLAWSLSRSSASCQSAQAFTRPALLLSTWLFFGLNFAFFQAPFPWRPWTSRTPNALVFTVCALGLTFAALAFSGRPLTARASTADNPDRTCSS